MSNIDLQVTMPEVKVTFQHFRVVNLPQCWPKSRRDRMPEDSDLEQYSRKRHPFAAATFGGKTIATLKEKETDTVLAVGAAWCSMSDNFNYKTGREIALARAMQNYLRRCINCWRECIETKVNILKVVPLAKQEGAGQELERGER